MSVDGSFYQLSLLILFLVKNFRVLGKKISEGEGGQIPKNFGGGGSKPKNIGRGVAE